LKTFISIELDLGETLEDAAQQLFGKRERICSCTTDETGPAPADAPEEAPAEEPVLAQKRKAAAARATAREKAKAEKAKEGAEPAEEAKAETAEAPAAGSSDAPSREDVRRAAMAKMNEGKREGVEDILKDHGGTLKDVPEADLADVLAEIEAL